MKKASPRAHSQELLPEYDFTNAVRGKYYERFRQGSNIVVLDPDVSAAFPDAASVNSALRTLATVARRSVVRRTSNRTGRPRKRVRAPKAAKTAPRDRRGRVSGR